MLKKVQKTIQKINMISPGDKILVGVSGGADSVCLLWVLSALAKDMEFSLEVVHVEHGIRGEESRRDAGFVKNLCENFGVFCQEVSVDVPGLCKKTGMGTEEAARSLRYEVFQKLALEKKAKVALAHHMEDNAETMLFQMVRGSGLTGLSGMQPMRQDEKGVTYIRPLMELRRSEIIDFLESHGADWCVDSTNFDLDYSRNYIRSEIIPALEKINAQAAVHMNHAAEYLRETEDFLQQEMQKAYAEIVKEKDRELEIDIEALQKLHIVLQKEILYEAVTKAVGKRQDITAVHIKDVLALCENQSGRQVSLPEGIAAQREYNQIRLGAKREENQDKQVIYISPEDLQQCMESKGSIEVKLSESGEKLIFRILSEVSETGEFPKKPYTKWLSYDKMKQGFCIRNRRSGDYFISDVLGHHKKLKQYFIDEKIPARERDRMWLLAQENLVLWLIGGRISEHIKITKDTKIILEIEYQGGN